MPLATEPKQLELEFKRKQSERGPKNSVSKSPTETIPTETNRQETIMVVWKSVKAGLEHF